MTNNSDVFNLRSTIYDSLSNIFEENIANSNETNTDTIELITTVNKGDIIKKLMNELETKLTNEMRQKIEYAFLTKYIEQKWIPRGLRIKKQCSFNVEDETFIKKWRDILENASLKLMELIKEYRGDTLIKLGNEINELELQLQKYKLDKEYLEKELKIKEMMNRTKKELLDIKKKKNIENTEVKNSATNIERKNTDQDRDDNTSWRTPHHNYRRSNDHFQANTNNTNHYRSTTFAPYKDNGDIRYNDHVKFNEYDNHNRNNGFKENFGYQYNYRKNTYPTNERQMSQYNYWDRNYNNRRFNSYENRNVYFREHDRQENNYRNFQSQNRSTQNGKGNYESYNRFEPLRYINTENGTDKGNQDHYNESRDFLGVGRMIREPIPPERENKNSRKRKESEREEQEENYYVKPKDKKKK
ncbi:uncharacterized protein DDB_G0287625-like [Bombina bombina]|uniref:uncharacterized protein DDB_G0287625-like n=1 Tax=Bombina bombina TaxID=8345 RepID=UPI00235A5A27|nr:uncharacterized protein DDB_G0287625-like [Bombina bombina]